MSDLIKQIVATINQEDVEATRQMVSQLNDKLMHPLVMIAFT